MANGRSHQNLTFSSNSAAAIVYNPDDDEDFERPWDSSSTYPVLHQLGAVQSEKLKCETPNDAVATHSDVTKALPAEKVAVGSSSLVSTMSLNDNKAGMTGLDKQRINQIIYEASKGSKFYINEERKEKRIQERVALQQQQLNKLTEEQRTVALFKADRLLEQLEERRDLTHTIVHVDMDAFFAAVEILEKPELRDRPMAVGGSAMLSTSNYAARRFGVRAAMPGFIARKLCPDLVIIPPNFGKYSAISEQVRRVFAIYDPGYSTASLDEAYLDITNHLEWRKSSKMEDRSFWGYDRPELVCHCSDCDGTGSNIDLCPPAPPPASAAGSQPTDTEVLCPKCCKPFGVRTLQTFGTTAEDAVREMRFRIYQRTCLTASAGIAANTMIAKICSDRNKPNGQFTVPSMKDDMLEFIRDLPIRKVCGIGKVTEKMLAGLNITSCSHLYDRRDVLYHLYSPLSFEHFMAISLGIGSSHVERDGERKSMSVERTFSELSSPEDLYKMCQHLSEMLADDLQDERLEGKTVAIKIKTVTFDVRTRAHTLAQWTHGAKQICAAAWELLRVEIAACEPQPLRLRLMGVRLSALRTVDSNSAAGTIVSLLRRCADNQTRNVDTSSVMDDPVAKYNDYVVKNAGTSCFNNIMLRIDEDLLEHTYSSVVAVERAASSEGRHTVDAAAVSDVASEVSSSSVICPVCSRTVVGDMIRINRHIDECLNVLAVRDILASEQQTPSTSKRVATTVENKSSTVTTKRKRKVTASSTVGALDKFFKSSVNN